MRNKKNILLFLEWNSKVGAIDLKFDDYNQIPHDLTNKVHSVLMKTLGDRDLWKNIARGNDDIFNFLSTLQQGLEEVGGKAFVEVSNYRAYSALTRLFPLQYFLEQWNNELSFWRFKSGFPEEWQKEYFSDPEEYERIKKRKLARKAFKKKLAQKSVSRFKPIT